MLMKIPSPFVVMSDPDANNAMENIDRTFSAYAFPQTKGVMMVSTTTTTTTTTGRRES